MAEEVSIIASLKDQFTGPLNKLVRGFRGLFSVAQRAGAALSAPFRAFGGVLSTVTRQLTSFRTLIVAGLGVQAVRTFASFESGLAQVSTLVDTAVVDMNRLKEGVISVGLETGESFDTLNRALFDIISAGVDAADAIDVLRQASLLAVGGATSTAEATAGLVSILNSYQLEASEAKRVSDALFQAMKGGITTIGALSSNLGKVTPLAEALGVSLEETVAAVSALTKGGLSTEEAVTALRATFTSFLKPTEELAELFDSGTIASRGFLQTMKDLAETTGLNDQQLSRLFPNVRALVGVLSLGKGDVKDFADIFGTMADAAGSTDEAAQKVLNTLENQFARTLRTVEAAIIRIVEAAKPLIEDVLTGIRSFFLDIANSENTIRAVFAGLIQFFERLGTLLGSIFDQREFVTVLINLIRTAIEAVAQTFLAGLPLLLRTAEFIGSSIARGLIQSFIGSSEREVAQALSQGGLGGFLTQALAGAAGFDTEKITEAAGKIRTFREEIARLQALLEERPPGENFATGLAAAAALDAAGGVEGVKKTVQELRSAIDEEFASLGESGAREAALAAEKELADTFADLPTRLGPVFENAFENLFRNTSGKTKEAAEDLKETFWAFFANVKAASEEDAKRSAEETVEEIGEAAVEKAREKGKQIREEMFGGGETEEESTAGAARKTRKEIEGASEELEHFGDLGSTVSRGVAGEFSNVASAFNRADFTFQSFFANFIARIGEMILQAIIFRAIMAGISSLFSAGAAAPIGGSSGLPGSLPGGQSLGNPLGGGSLAANKGGILGRFGGMIRRYAGGTPFVPGERGANVDTVPALLTVGEGVIQRPSVDFYGRRAIQAINDRRIPSGILRALAGTGSVPKVSVGPGFQGGGFPAAGGAAAAGMPLGIMPTDRATTEALTRGQTKTSLLRLMALDPAEFRRALGIRDREVR